MNERRIRRAVAEMAASVGAELPPRPRGVLGRFFQRLLGATRAKPDQRPTSAVFDTAAGRPRDLNDPFGGSEIQRRVGTAIAEKARTRKRGREG